MGKSLKNTRMVFDCVTRSSINNDGFTLIELLISVAIVGMLATIALFSFSELRTQVRTTRCISEIRGLEKDIIAYASEKGTYPASLNDVGMDTLKDPWGHLYEYHPPNTRQLSGQPINEDFDLFSIGFDGLPFATSIIDPESDDDIIRGSDGAYVGIASLYM